MIDRVDLRTKIAWSFLLSGWICMAFGLPVLATPFFTSATTIFVINLQELKSAKTN